MNISTDLSYLLRLFAMKRNSSQITLASIKDFLHQYAKRYIQQNPDLVVYLEITQELLLKELKKLQAEDLVGLYNDKSNTTIIFIPHFFIDQTVKLYSNIEANPEIPFPLLSDLPKSFPAKLLHSMLLGEDFAQLETSQDGNNFMYAVGFNGDTPTMIFPGHYNIDKILNLAISKVKLLLIKDELRDFMQKRLMLANPSKEYTVRNFMSRIGVHSADTFKGKATGDISLMWGQLCAFIKQEYSKKNEKLPDEIALLQATGIIEYLNNYYRNRSQKDLQTETALKNLLLNMQRPPYLFTMKQIAQFTDTRSIPLLGQYTEETLKNFMKEKTTSSEKYIVPDILTFTNTLGERFYVLAENAVPLTISLINEARKDVYNECTKKWHSLLIKFEQDDSMKNERAFADLIRLFTADISPNLYGILNAPFVNSLLSDPRLNEIQNLEITRIFPDGKLAPYSQILLLNREEILNDVKIMLPFWYTFPIISSIIAFFKRPRKQTEKQKTKQPEHKTIKPKLTLKDVAEGMTAKFVPAGENIDELLTRYLDNWNQNIDPKARENLTEDVNALIRDYVRGVQKTLSASNFTPDRVSSLAQTLVVSHSLSKIKNSKALQKYIELYILKVIKKYF